MDDTLLPNKDDSPEFGQSFIKLSGLFDKLVRRIFIALALALGKNSDYLLEMYKKQFTDQNFTTLRTLFYPAITENEYLENTGSAMANVNLKLNYLITMAKVIREKSRGERSLMGQDTIENVS